jgi:hypothetical protein
MSRHKSPVLSAIKYGALIFLFGLGYHVASKDYPQTSALVGWVVGFLLGLRLKMVWADRRS